MSEGELVSLVVGFIVGVMPGLWWGERGRRLDAQRREAGRSVLTPTPASVTGPEDVSPAKKLIEGTPMAELAEPPQQFIDETMAETGCSREEAVAEWHTLLGKLPTGGEGVEWPATS